MKKINLYIVFFIFLLSNNIFSQTPQYVPGEIIVCLKSGANVQSLVARNSSIGLQVKEALWPELNIYLLSYSSSSTLAKTSIDQDPAVLYSQFNHILTLRTLTPNDPRFYEQWALNNTGQTGGTFDADIDAPEAWGLTTGGTTVAGDQIVIAVIDNGFDLNHQDISYFKNTHEIAGNGIDDDGNGYVDDYHGWNAYLNNGNIPTGAHGTHVAGIAGAKGNNNTGISGVNWNVKILPIAVSLIPNLLETIVVRAYRYAWKMRQLYNQTNGLKGAFIVATNSSFGKDQGNPANHPIWCQMYDTLGAVGILNCAATANENWDIDVVGDIPTSCPSEYLVTVTNTTHTDTKNIRAAYGANTIDLGAPGTSILSTTPSNNYGLETGTSMASPHVAGVIALMFAAVDSTTLTAYKNNPSIKALQFKAWLLAAVDQIPSLQGITVTGGRLNAYKAVLNAKGVSFKFVNKIEGTENYGSLVIDNEKENPVPSGTVRSFSFGTPHTVRTNELPFIVNWNNSGKTVKYHRFYSENSDYNLHHSFTALPTTPYVQDANFNSTATATLLNEFPEAGNLNPVNDSISFKDPWFYFKDANNNWFQTNELKNYQSPFNILNNSLASYGGVFLNQSGPPLWMPPYYSVGAISPQSVTINGRTHNFYFQNWSREIINGEPSAEFQNANALQTPVVLKKS